MQETGPDGAAWALALRGLDAAALAPAAGAPGAADPLVRAWTLRGAPHAYRRADLPSVAAAVRPWSDADAAKRVFDAAKPLKAAGIPVRQALDALAAAQRELVREPTPKGALSTALTARMPAPYLRDCRACAATHPYEQPFRLAALAAGLELLPGTSPPVLAPVPGLHPAAAPEPRHEPVRAVLHLLGPCTPKQVAAHVDAPLAEVRARWPEDAVEVVVDGEARSLLAGDVDDLAADPPGGTRLLGPYDLLLQGRDRATLVPDPARARELWPVLGRPGAVLHGAELVGTWRPRAAGRDLRVVVTPWRPLPRAAQQGVQEQAERLAAHRGRRLAGVETA